MQTSRAIVDLLSRESHSVADLASQLDLSRNAVHVQLSKLHAAGVVEQEHQRLKSGPGKPALRYRLAAGQEDAFSTAHQLAFESLLAAMGDTLKPAQRLKVLEEMGERMAAAAALGPPGEEGLAQAIAAVNALGANARIIDDAGVTLIECNTCPLATAVRCEPQLCDAVAVVFSRGAGCSVKARCEHGERLRCLFEVSKN